jgi:YVTN family beta-propeller protein
MIDAATYTLHGSIPTGKEPAHIILTPDGKTAYATNGNDDTVTAIDVATMKAVATIPVGAYPHGLRPSPDGKWVYVANAKGTTLSIIEVATNRKVADVEVGQKPVQVAFDPDGQFAYVSLNGENAVGKVEVATQRLVGKVQVGVGPIQVFVSADNKYLLAANQGTKDNPSTTVSIIDTKTFSVIDTVETGKGAHGVVIDPSSTHAYITNIYGNDVAVLDLAERKVVATIPVDAGPNGISFTPLVPAQAPTLEITLPVPHQDDANMPAMQH